MKPEPKFKKGQKVYAYGIGIGRIISFYERTIPVTMRKEFLYSINLGNEFTAGNVPEDFIQILKINDSQKTR